MLNQAELLRPSVTMPSAQLPQDLISDLSLSDIPDADCYDPYCDPGAPQVVTYEDVAAASLKISDGSIRKTPCLRSPGLSSMYEMDLYFKKEYNQVSGSFKERGARNVLMSLDNEQRTKGVIASSAGNHALALAYHGKLLDIPVVVVMPTIAPLVKVKNCRGYGAQVILKGADIGESKKYAMYIAKNTGMKFINGYDHPKILAGAGTTGLEIMEAVHHLDAIVVPIGGAGLVAGIAVAAKAVKPDIQIIGVEAENCPSFAYARKQDKPSFMPSIPSLADGLAVPTVGVNAFATANPLVDMLVTVKESSIALAILRLVEMEKCVVEGAGASGLAAIVEGKLDFLKGKRVAMPLCGGNIDTTVLGRCLDRGLAADGRLVSLTVQVTDRPGGLAKLTDKIAALGASVRDIHHQRPWVMTDVYSVNVKCVVETHGLDHAKQLHRALAEEYEVTAWSLACTNKTADSDTRNYRTAMAETDFVRAKSGAGLMENELKLGELLDLNANENPAHFH